MTHELKPEEEHFASAWTKDLENNTPLICVAGKNAKIQVINALTGELTQVSNYMFVDIMLD